MKKFLTPKAWRVGLRAPLFSGAQLYKYIITYLVLVSLLYISLNRELKRGKIGFGSSR